MPLDDGVGSKEAVRFGAHHLLLNARGNGAPQRDPTISVVIVVEVTPWPPITNKEARFAVTRALVHIWESERDPTNVLEGFHRAITDEVMFANSPHEKRPSVTEAGVRPIAVSA